MQVLEHTHTLPVCSRVCKSYFFPWFVSLSIKSFFFLTATENDQFSFSSTSLVFQTWTITNQWFSRSCYAIFFFPLCQRSLLLHFSTEQGAFSHFYFHLFFLLLRENSYNEADGLFKMRRRDKGAKIRGSFLCRSDLDWKNLTFYSMLSTWDW